MPPHVPSAVRALLRVVYRRLHWAPVAAAAIANLWALAGELQPADAFNDGVVHQSMIEWAIGQLREGRLPLDGWFPYFNLGASEFHRYQSLPHLLMALPGLAIGASAAYHWSLYLLLATWPLSVYWGARLLGWEGWAAAVAAALSPIVSSATCYGYEDCTYVWWGLGAWTQLWGMWLLPIAWGLSWRAVSGRGSLALGAIALAAVAACHFLTGYLALLTVPFWVLIGVRGIPIRALRAAAVGAVAAAALAWIAVPLLQDTAWLPQSEFNVGTYWLDSYGAPKVLGWLVHGQLLDNGHFPLLSLLLGLGLVAALATLWLDERPRALLAVFVLSLLLFIGRSAIGPILAVLPFGAHLFLHRYLFGVQLASLLLAGSGVYTTVRWGLLLAGRVRWHPRLARPALIVAAAAALIAGSVPGWQAKLAQASYHDQLRQQQIYYQTTDGAGLEYLLQVVKSRGDGRAYAGMAGTPSGMSYAVGYMPALSLVEKDQVDAVGFTLRVNSLMIDPEARFDQWNASEYDLYNVKYVLLPDGQKPAVPAQPLQKAGRHVLWQVKTSGYFEVVDQVWPGVAERSDDVGKTSASFLNSPQLAALQFPAVAFNGASLPDPTLDRPAAGAPGAVTSQSAHLADGVFTAHVTADRPAMVLLKESFDPRWEATVDGVPAKPVLMAPALVGIPVAAGDHDITVHYEPSPYYPELIAFGALCVLALGFGPWWWRRRRGAVPSAVAGNINPPQL